MVSMLPNQVTVLKANERLNKMLTQARQQGLGSNDTEQLFITGIDPGETTGLAHYNPADDGIRLSLQQVKTRNVVDGVLALDKAIPRTQWPALWIIEDYRVYSWKTDDHAWAGLHTAKLIGALLLLAHQRQTPVHIQMASEGKQFATDELLRSLSLYDPGQKHARDASRHVVTHIFKGQPKYWVSSTNTPED